jgi:complement component 1 Q subcomponent-binding protein
MLGRIVRPLCRVSRLSKPSGVFRLARGFAGPADIDKAEKKLVKILNQEIEFEEDNYQEDGSVKQFLQDNKWVLEDKEGSNVLVMKKVSGNSVVQIYFSSRSPSFNDEEEQPEDGQEKKPEGENAEGEAPNQEFTDFNVYITQGKKTIAFECVSVGGEIEVNNCNVIDDINVHRSMVPFGMVAVESYKGPDFATLDESLQQAMFDLLRSHGINEEVSQLIEHLALAKEQRLYMRWLKEVKQFIDQKK